MLQAESLVDGLKATRRRRPYNVELFAGSPDDNNATFFWNGAMTVLQPLIDSGDDQGRLRPDRLRAGRHPALGPGHRPEAHGGPADQDLHRQETVNGVLSPYDGLSLRHHRGPEGQRLRQRRQAAPGRHRPGRRDRSRSSRSSRASSTPRSSRTPASSPRSPSTMIEAIADGKKPEVNDTKTYDNGVKVVPTLPARARSPSTRTTSPRSWSTRATTPQDEIDG